MFDRPSVRIVPSLVFTSLVLAGCDSSETPGVGPPDPPARAYFGEPAWHPDGRYIAAEHADSLDTDGDGRKDDVFGGIWLVDAETGETQPLLGGFGAPTWSPEGERLAVHGGAQIYAVDVESLNPARADSTSLRQLTFEGRNFFPAWSPDGEWIAYDNTVCGGPTEPIPSSSCGILTTDTEGKGRQFIARGRMPDWFPDGSALIYYGLYSDIYRVALADTSNIVRLTSFNSETDRYVARNQHPRYSPDGTRIAFVSQQFGPAALWIMNADGTNQRQVTPVGMGARSFDWSPDGQRLVFLHRQEYCFNCGEPEPPGSGELWLINADGTGLDQLTHFRSP